MHPNVFVSFLVDTLLDDIIILPWKMRIITLFLLVFYNSFTYRVLQHFFPWVSKSCQEQGSSCIEAWTIPNCVRILFEAFWWKAAQGLYFDAQANMSFFYRATKFSCFDVFCQIFFFNTLCRIFVDVRCSCVFFCRLVFVYFSCRCNCCGPFLLWRCLRMHLSRPLPLTQKTTKHGTGR